MSGPFVRRYGFPNFGKNLGKHPLEHGVDEPEENAFAVKGDEKPSGSMPASRAIPRRTRAESAARRQVIGTLT